MNSRLLTAAEVAEMLGVPRSWVYEQSRQGRIPTVALGRYRRFREEAIGRMVEQLEQRATAGGRCHGGSAVGRAEMARRSYGSGSLIVRADANGTETWYALWRVGGRRVKRALGPKRAPARAPA